MTTTCAMKAAHTPGIGGTVAVGNDSWPTGRGKPNPFALFFVTRALWNFVHVLKISPKQSGCSFPALDHMDAPAIPKLLCSLFFFLRHSYQLAACVITHLCSNFLFTSCD